MNFRDELSTINEAQKELVIWGIPKGEKDEQVLFTKAKTDKEAKNVIKILTDKHGVTKARVQVIDFSTGIDFSAGVK